MPEQNAVSRATIWGYQKSIGKPGNSLSGFEIELLMTLVRIPSYTGQTHYMARFISDLIAGFPGLKSEFKDGNIYITKGELAEGQFYPCVVAHTDTVHAINYNVQPYINGDILFAIDTATTKQYGTGGDDKVGIYIGIMALLKLDKVKVAFFRDEERGCIGSRLADMNFFKDVGFVLQADRRGRYDITDNINSIPVLNKAFKDSFSAIMEKHKRVYVTGAMTDVIALVNKGLTVCACNISCGYYEPHTSYETINLLHVQETRDFVFDLLEGVGLKEWPFPERFKREDKVSSKTTTVWQPPRSTYYDGWGERDYEAYQGGGYSSRNNVNRNEGYYEFMSDPRDYCQACGSYMAADNKSAFSGFCKNCVEDVKEKENDKVSGKDILP